MSSTSTTGTRPVQDMVNSDGCLNQTKYESADAPRARRFVPTAEGSQTPAQKALWMAAGTYASTRSYDTDADFKSEGPDYYKFNISAIDREWTDETHEVIAHTADEEGNTSMLVFRPKHRPNGSKATEEDRAQSVQRDDTWSIVRYGVDNNRKQQYLDHKPIPRHCLHDEQPLTYEDSPSSLGVAKGSKTTPDAPTSFVPDSNLTRGENQHAIVMSFIGQAVTDSRLAYGHTILAPRAKDADGASHASGPIIRFDGVDDFEFRGYRESSIQGSADCHIISDNYRIIAASVGSQGETSTLVLERIWPNHDEGKYKQHPHTLLLQYSLENGYKPYLRCIPGDKTAEMLAEEAELAAELEKAQGKSTTGSDPDCSVM